MLAEEPVFIGVIVVAAAVALTIIAGLGTLLGVWPSKSRDE